MEGAVLIAAVVAFGLVFDFTNGFHDAANAMATPIATGALSPRVAVGASGVLNLAGAFLSLSVAATIATGIVSPTSVTTVAVLAGLTGAITWNLVTWLFSLPSSSSHAIVGGIIGAALVQAGPRAVDAGGVVSRVLVPAVGSPLITAAAAGLAVFVSERVTARASRELVTRGFRLGQVVSSSLVSLAHGTNDAQKTMGIITLALISNHDLGPSSGPPSWVVVLCATAMALGTYAGGWRIIRTLGRRVTSLTPAQGFAAEATTSAVILGAASLGYAVSTTQAASGSIVGVGVGRRTPVRWPIVGRMLVAWLLTIPCGAACGAVAVAVADGVGGLPGVAVTAAGAVAIFGALYALSRRAPVTAGNVNAPEPERPPVAAPAGRR